MTGHRDLFYLLTIYLGICPRYPLPSLPVHLLFLEADVKGPTVACLGIDMNCPQDCIPSYTPMSGSYCLVEPIGQKQPD